MKKGNDSSGVTRSNQQALCIFDKKDYEVIFSSGGSESLSAYYVLTFNIMSFDSSEDVFSCCILIPLPSKKYRYHFSDEPERTVD